MTDIVERLRAEDQSGAKDLELVKLFSEAAAEIEQLQAQVARLLKQVTSPSGYEYVSTTHEAMQEIERLREALSAAQAGLKEYGDEAVEMRSEIERLRTLVKNAGLMP